MKAKKKPADEFRMKASDFDAIMRRALGAPPEPKKPKAKKRARRS